jgi:hypothetical protein
MVRRWRLIGYFPILYYPPPSTHVCCGPRASRGSCDDRRVVAVGGNDRTTFQYKTHGVNWDDGVPVSVSVALVETSTQCVKATI